MSRFLSGKSRIKSNIKITLCICIQIQAYKNYKEIPYAYSSIF